MGASKYYRGQLPGRQTERVCGNFPPLNMVGLPDPVAPLAPLPADGPERGQGYLIATSLRAIGVPKGVPVVRSNRYGPASASTHFMVLPPILARHGRTQHMGGLLSVDVGSSIEPIAPDRLGRQGHV